MEVVENLSRIVGTVEAVGSAPQGGRVTLDVRLSSAEPVDQRADLLGRQVGGTVQIAVPAELVGGAKVGDQVGGTVRMAGPGQIVAAPQVDGGEPFTVRG
jgi:hypothetical protein